jgi:hypothetical protein
MRCLLERATIDRMRWLVFFALAACPADEEPHWTSKASCTIASHECFEYDLTMPSQRDQLRASCAGAFDQSDSCGTNGRIGGCEVDRELLHGTYIYQGFSDVAAFMTECTANGGTWNP